RYPLPCLFVLRQDQPRSPPGGPGQGVDVATRGLCKFANAFVERPPDAERGHEAPWHARARGNGTVDKGLCQEGASRAEPGVREREVPHEIEVQLPEQLVGSPQGCNLPQHVVEAYPSLSSLPEAGPLRQVDIDKPGADIEGEVSEPLLDRGTVVPPGDDPRFAHASEHARPDPTRPRF